MTTLPPSMIRVKPEPARRPTAAPPGGRGAGARDARRRSPIGMATTTPSAIAWTAVRAAPSESFSPIRRATIAAAPIAEPHGEGVDERAGPTPSGRRSPRRRRRASRPRRRRRRRRPTRAPSRAPSGRRAGRSPARSAPPCSRVRGPGSLRRRSRRARLGGVPGSRRRSWKRQSTRGTGGGFARRRSGFR